MAVPTLASSVSTGVTAATASVAAPSLLTPAVGDVLVVKVAVVGTTPTLTASTCSDSLGNTYTRQITTAAGNTAVAILLLG